MAISDNGLTVYDFDGTLAFMDPVQFLSYALLFLAHSGLAYDREQVVSSFCDTGLYLYQGKDLPVVLGEFLTTQVGSDLNWLIEAIGREFKNKSDLPVFDELQFTDSELGRIVVLSKIKPAELAAERIGLIKMLLERVGPDNLLTEKGYELLTSLSNNKQMEINIVSAGYKSYIDYFLQNSCFAPYIGSLACRVYGQDSLVELAEHCSGDQLASNQKELLVHFLGDVAEDGTFSQDQCAALRNMGKPHPLLLVLCISEGIRKNLAGFTYFGDSSTDIRLIEAYNEFLLSNPHLELPAAAVQIVPVELSRARGGIQLK